MTNRLIADYLDEILAQYHYLDFRGIMQMERVVSLTLDEVFIPLKARRIEKETDSDLDELTKRLEDPDLPEDEREANEAALRERGVGTGKKGAPVPEPEEFPEILARHRQCVLLGDPGSGKTTLVKWLARTFALGPQAAKERLGLEEDLIPIVVPVMACTEGFGDGEEIEPLRYVREYWNEKAPGLGDRLEEAARNGQAFLLFDGLDEVTSKERRRAAARGIQRTINLCSKQGPTGSRCLVTSRIYGYDLCRISRVPRLELAPLEDPQIDRFAKGWCWGLERALHPDAPRKSAADAEAEELLQAIRAEGGAKHRETLQTFAQNPLLLTILALVKRQYGTLPDLRAQLYEVALKTLVGTWNRMRSLGGPIRGRKISLERTIRLWEPVALWMHREHPGGTAPRGRILAQLTSVLVEDGEEQDDAWATAESYLDTAAHWAGLLVERGDGVFGFLHQTFQEYLAARALVREAPEPYWELEPYFFDPRWREVILLAVGYLSAGQERTRDTTRLVDAIRETTDVLEPILHRHLLLAAAILAERVEVHPKCVEQTLLSLLGEVRSSSKKVDFAHALASLAPVATAPVVRQAGEVLSGGDIDSWKLRASIVLLAQGARQDAETLLAKALEDDDQDVRSLAAAFSVLACRVELDVLKHLKGAWRASKIPPLDQGASSVLKSAATHPAAHLALRDLLRNADPEVRLRSAQTLQATGTLTQETEEALVGLLAVKDSLVRLQAAQTLQANGTLTQKTQETLVRLLAVEDPIVRLWAAQTLQANRTLSRETQKALVALLVDEDSSVRFQAAQALQATGTLFRENEEALVKLLTVKDLDVRLLAAETFQATGTRTQETQEAMIELLTVREPYFRLRAAQGLLALRARTQKTQEALVEILTADDPDIRLLAAQTLQGTGARTQEAQKALGGLLAVDDPHVRLRAARTLQATGACTQEAQEALVGLLSVDDPHAQIQAARNLQAAGTHTQKAQETLLGLLSVEVSFVRLQVANALEDTAIRCGSAGTRPPDWLDLCPPRRLGPRPARTERTEPDPEPGGHEPPEERIEDLLTAILAQLPDGDVHALLDRFQAALRYSEALPEPPRPSRRTTETLLEALHRCPALGDIAPGNEVGADLRKTLVAVLAGRFTALASRAKDGASVSEEETDLVGRLPDVLFVELAHHVLDGLSEEAIAAIRRRLLATPFAPDGVEAERIIDLYAPMSRDASADDRKEMLRRVSQASLVADPEIRGAGLSCLGIFLPHLQGKERRQVFGAMLTGATKDKADRVRKSVAWSLRMVANDLTLDELDALNRERVPPLSELL